MAIASHKAKVRSKLNGTEQQKRKPYSPCFAVTPPAIMFLRVLILRHLSFHSQHFSRVHPLSRAAFMLHRKRCGLFIVYLFSQVEFKIVLPFINSVTGFDSTNLIIWQTFAISGNNKELKQQ